ncbi:MAG: hypothetical protein KAH32_06335, partial [Chlamydiia bacterium]|nr:hypothetical protein [Chlamydiia bacterium]
DELTGVEQFLTNYGVNGGIISYEDGESARFSSLSSSEQAEVLSSLVNESVPTVDEKYNLDQSEIDLLNAVRESDSTPVDFINNILDSRLNDVLAYRDASETNYDTMSNDAIYLKHLQDSNPNLTEGLLMEELETAKTMMTYDSTIQALRSGYVAAQTNLMTNKQNADQATFNNSVELQREEIVGDVQHINDIAGAQISDEMKDYLLHDMMEMNDSQDPILMEKIFSSPEAMFKTNWFLNYGEDYIKNLNTYYKKEISKASKAGYNQATSGMPTSPSRSYRGTTQNFLGNKEAHNDRSRNILSEEDLFGA